jgi:hypothetical protein
VRPKRGDRAAPPPIGDEFDLRFANTEAANGWDHLSRHAAGNLRRAFDKIRSTPRAADDPSATTASRASSALWSGRDRRWSAGSTRCTGGGRIWYLVDDANRTAWITYAGTRHPKATD